MRLFITIIVALIVSVGLGVLAVDDPGYVVLTRAPWVVRLPLLLFIGILFLVFVLLYLLFNFIASLSRAPQKYRKWKIRSQQNSAQQHTMQGYAWLIEGNWPKAEAALLNKLEFSKTPLMNYLGAAYASQQQGLPERRNHYLDEALARHPSHELAINLTRARLLYHSGEVVECRDHLEKLRAVSPGNVAVARLLADVYRELEDWDALTRLTGSLKKLQAFPEEETKNRERHAFERLLSSPALLQGESDRPARVWKSLPAKKRKDPDMVVSYVKQLIKTDRLKEAEKELRIALNRGLDRKLINLYGKVRSPYVNYQIELIESFIKKHDNDPDLLLALARLYRYEKNYAKARDLYRQSIQAGAPGEACIDLASLLEQMGETDAALFFFKKGAAGLLSDAPDSRDAATKGEMLLTADNPAMPGETLIHTLPLRQSRRSRAES